MSETQLQEPKEKQIPITFLASSRVKSMINEMAKYYEVGQAAFLRLAVKEFFNGRYRKEKFGYHSTVEAGERRQKRFVRDERATEMLTMSDDELTEYIHLIGYGEKWLAGDVPCRHVIYDDKMNGRGMYQVYEYADGARNYAFIKSIEGIIQEIKKRKLI